MKSQSSSVSRTHRMDVLKALESRYSDRSGLNRIRLKSKMLAWYIAIYFSSALKRVIDIVGSLIGLAIFSPVFIIVGVLIYAHDKGPIIFIQRRVGRWGREFDFPKFRSMVRNAEELKSALMSQNQHADGVTFKIKKDPRITPVGRFIRKTSIDELPQLWCVLMGDMSLVGPRPQLPNEVIKYTLAQRRRLDIKPGLTCFWQIEGRGDIPFSKQADLDIQYVDSQSLFLDVLLILKTVPAVLLGKGAY